MPEATEETVVDVDVENHGSLFLFRLNTDAATQWVDENIQGEQTWFAGALAVEHGYARGLAQAMLSDGLNVK